MLFLKVKKFLLAVREPVTDIGRIYLHVVEDKEESVNIKPAVEVQRVPDRRRQMVLIRRHDARTVREVGPEKKHTPWLEKKQTLVTCLTHDTLHAVRVAYHYSNTFSQ